MTLLNEADAIYIGANAADKVYLGANLVWEPLSGGGPWTPVQINIGMTTWYDAADPATLTFSGPSLTQWAGKSPAALTAVPTATGPTLTSVNGLGSLLFAGNPLIVTTPTTYSGDFIVFAVFTPSSSTPVGHTRIVDHGFTNSFWFGRDSGTQNWGGGVMHSVPPYGIYTPCVFDATHQLNFKRTGTTLLIRANGGATAVSEACTGVATGTRELRIGSEETGVALFYGAISEILIWSRDLSLDEVRKTEGYLAHKWGIQAKLPAGHPYKAAPPVTGEPPLPTGPTSSLLTSFGPPGTDRNDFTGEVGVRLGIGASPFTVSWMGARRHHVSQTGAHTLKLYEWFSQAVQRTTTIDYTGVAVGSYAWSPITPITLPAGSYYALLMETISGDGQVWCNPGPASYTGMANVYDSYWYSGLQTGTPNAAFIGLDLGW